jgi:FkbM family methyltransferase
MKSMTTAMAAQEIPIRAQPEEPVRGMRSIYRRLLPTTFRERARIGAIPNAVRFAADRRSYANYRKLARPGARLRNGGPVPVRLRPLHGAQVLLRPSTSDVAVVEATFADRYHLPPADAPLSAEPRILDLGSNIGLTVAHFAVLYPTAQILGVEMDADNAKLALHNTEPWRDRCQIINAAAWHCDGEVRYRGTAGDEVGFQIVEGADTTIGDRARAISMDTLIAELAGGSAPIDYVKVDIEGAEEQVLRTNTSWTERVHSIKVELHDLHEPDAYGFDACRADLEALGFRTRVDDRHCATVIGVRPVGLTRTRVSR